jgi:hypothetical protein
MAPRSKAKRLDNPYPEVVPPALTLVKSDSDEMGADSVSFEDGTLRVEHPDGSVTIDLSPPGDQDDPPDGDEFDRNLALSMSDDDLGSISTDLIEGIDRDNESRKKWLDTRALGIGLLGLELEKPRAGAGTESAPIEGMSTVRHPLLLEATVSFQATARAELLPASGPVKVRNDTPTPPKEIVQETSAQPQLLESMQSNDELSQALEKDLNHYLTAVATEYVPDTDRMLFYIGFGGDGFKKVYNCPLRRRPVSESIDAEDLIISNTATDLCNSGRVTHRIKMRQSTLKRMQILGVYRDVELSPPTISNPTAVDKKLEAISGVTESNKLPEDRDFEVYETYCELDIDKYAPDQFKGKGLPLPYRVTIEKESKKILDIRRNWKEEDEQCLAKQFFVQFPFIRGLGFYGLGFIHLLGNTTNALTAGWREALDAGMFANFPGFIYAKGAGRQLTNQIRIPPGGGYGLDIGAGQRIQDAIMGVPYKEAGAGFINLLGKIEEGGRRLASTAEVSVGEGKQDAPVGTTLALIEQASKVMDSAHKRLHAAQAEEFKLLKCRFQEDPESFWRHNKKPTIKWKKDQFLAALDNCELVPVADPNNPTSLHRLAKGAIIKQLQTANPALYDAVAVDMRVMRISDIDPAGLMRPTPAPAPPDPRMVAIQKKAEAQELMSKIQLMETQIRAATAGAQIQDKAKDRESRERIEQMKIRLQQLDLEQSQIQHKADEEKIYARMMHELNTKAQLAAHGAQVEAVEAQHGLHLDAAETAHGLQVDKAKTDHELRTNAERTEHEKEMARERHNAEMTRAHEKHQLDMQHAKELHAHKLEAAKQMARAKPKKAKE